MSLGAPGDQNAWRPGYAEPPVIMANLLVSMTESLSANWTCDLELLCSRSEPSIFEKSGIEMFPCTDRHFEAFLLQCRPDITMHHSVFKRSQSSLENPVKKILEFSELPLDLPLSLYLSGYVMEFLLVTSQFRDLSDTRNECLLSSNEMGRVGYPSARCSSVSAAFRSTLASILDPGSMESKTHTISQNTIASALYRRETSRVMCLFHIHAMLWIYRHDTWQTDAYMQRLVREVQRNGLVSSKSLGALNWVLVWLCLSDSNLNLAKMEMGWKMLTRMVLRLLRVALRLSHRSWQCLEDAMFGSLVGTTRARERGEGETLRNSETSREVHNWLEPEVVWKDIMSQ